MHRETAERIDGGGRVARRGGLTVTVVVAILATSCSGAGDVDTTGTRKVLEAAFDAVGSVRITTVNESARSSDVSVATRFRDEGAGVLFLEDADESGQVLFATASADDGFEYWYLPPEDRGDIGGHPWLRFPSPRLTAPGVTPPWHQMRGLDFEFAAPLADTLDGARAQRFEVSAVVPADADSQGGSVDITVWLVAGSVARYELKIIDLAVMQRPDQTITAAFEPVAAYEPPAPLADHYAAATATEAMSILNADATPDSNLRDELEYQPVPQ